MSFLGLGLFDPSTADEPVDLDELCPSASEMQFFSSSSSASAPASKSGSQEKKNSKEKRSSMPERSK